MNPTRATVLVAALALTGCASPATVDTISPDAPREEKDAVYTTYVQDTYGEEFPGDPEAADELPQMALWLCSALDDGMPGATSMETLALDDLKGRERDAARDIVYQGVRVYCPEHVDSVEWMNKAAA